MKEIPPAPLPPPIIPVVIITPPVILSPHEPTPVLIVPPPPTILIVDSDPDARIHTAQAFERHGCNAILAATLAEALTCLARPWLNISVVMTAVDLSDGPGETIIIVVNNTSRLSHIRTVAHAWASAGVSGERVLALVGHGMSAWVERPCEWGVVWGCCFPGD